MNYQTTRLLFFLRSGQRQLASQAVSSYGGASVKRGSYGFLVEWENPSSPAAFRVPSRICCCWLKGSAWLWVLLLDCSVHPTCPIRISLQMLPCIRMCGRKRAGRKQFPGPGRRPARQETGRTHARLALDGVRLLAAANNRIWHGSSVVA